MRPGPYRAQGGRIDGAARALALAGALWAAGCATAARPAPPAPVPAPAIPVPPPILDADREVVLTPPPPAPASPGDPILSSPLAGMPEVVDRIHYWILRWQVWGEDYFTRYLSRMESYLPLVDSLVAERGLPPSLRYLPIVESGYNPRAVSPVGAVGMWQFMDGTARFRGLEVTPLLDERREPLRATETALDYLGYLGEKFGGSWFLALAAYNGGPGRVERTLRRHAPGARSSDSLFWALRGAFPSETREFVPKLLAAARVASNPDRYGFVLDDDARSYSDAERVRVPDATSLDVVARAAGVSAETIEDLNPHLLRGYTPPDRETAVWVPGGTGERFREVYPTIPPAERVSFVEHKIRRGETLTHVASRYGVALGELLAANPGLRPRRLQIGQWVVVPRAPTGRVASAETRRVRPAAERASAGTSATTAAVGSGGAHRVRRGESLWEIARAYGLGLSELRALNGFGDDPVLHPGDEIRLPEGRALVYRVRPGDTLSGIASRHGVPTDVVLRLNGLSRSSVIRPGDRIRLPGRDSG